MAETKEIKRIFIPGEEWLYYKLYCGCYSQDIVLIKNILPIVSELKRKKLIDHWFFIRYNDPNAHLRLRFHLVKKKNNQKVIRLIYTYFRKLIENDIIYDVVIATYKREMERYGKTIIEEVEKLFHYHSEKTLKLISNTIPEQDEISRIFASLHMIDNLLDAFFCLDQKQDFVLNLKSKFKEEYNIGKENNKKLDFLYRRYRKEIESFLTGKQEPENFIGLNKILKKSKKEIETLKTIMSKVSDNIGISQMDFIASVIHMNVNRCFRSKQRQYEMLCYDFMSRYYKSKLVIK